MTTPRYDIAGLIQELTMGYVRTGDRTQRKAATAIDALQARVKELEGERDDALDRVEELEQNAEVVSDEFEKDCWKAMRSLLSECKFDWRDIEPDGVTADDARDHIHETLKELELSWQREQERALRAEQERDEAYERAAKWFLDRFHTYHSTEIAYFLRRLAGPEKA